MPCPTPRRSRSGLQFKRRFWEEDDQIFGGISYTDLPITQISYPSTGFNTTGKGVLLGCYTWNGPNSYEFTALPPEERVKRVVEYGAQIHPQYKEEFENGVSWAWHRSPFTLGCAGDWTEEAQEGALRQSLPDRRAHRAGRRACLLHSGVAGRCDPVLAERDRAPAPARSPRVTAMPPLLCSLDLARHATRAYPAHRLVAAVALVTGFAASTALADSAGATFSEGKKFTERTGEALYSSLCQACHMDQAQGAVGAGAYPALARNQNLETSDYPVDVILHGQKGMPPVGQMMDDEQVAAVVNYVRTHFGNNYTDAVTAEDVAGAR